MTSSAESHDLDKAEQRLVAEAVVARLQKALTDNGWSLRELAKKAGVSPMLLSQVMRMETSLSVATLLQIADVVKCPLSEFFPSSS
jgi:transcriptional regulator with XRE-family HTH domain